MNRNRGFTLIEMLITVTILIILAAVAIPNYRGHVLRSNRSDAMAALMRIAAAQEKFYLQNNTYTNTLGTDGLNIETTSANEHFNLTVRDADLAGFVAEATATGKQTADEKCAFFSIDQAGNRFAKSDTDADTTGLCWR